MLNKLLLSIKQTISRTRLIYILHKLHLLKFDQTIIIWNEII